jgi:hypothetical protein
LSPKTDQPPDLGWWFEGLDPVGAERRPTRDTEQFEGGERRPDPFGDPEPFFGGITKPHSRAGDGRNRPHRFLARFDLGIIDPLGVLQDAASIDKAHKHPELTDSTIWQAFEAERVTFA